MGCTQRYNPYDSWHNRRTKEDSTNSAQNENTMAHSHKGRWCREIINNIFRQIRWWYNISDPREKIQANQRYGNKAVWNSLSLRKRTTRFSKFRKGRKFGKRMHEDRTLIRSHHGNLGPRRRLPLIWPQPENHRRSRSHSQRPSWVHLHGWTWTPLLRQHRLPRHQSSRLKRKKRKKLHSRQRLSLPLLQLHSHGRCLIWKL